MQEALLDIILMFTSEQWGQIHSDASHGGSHVDDTAAEKCRFGGLCVSRVTPPRLEIHAATPKTSWMSSSAKPARSAINHISTETLALLSSTPPTPHPQQDDSVAEQTQRNHDCVVGDERRKPHKLHTFPSK